MPVTFVILRNGSYGALRWFAGLLDVPNAPGLDIPDIDFVAIAHGYGVDAVHAHDVGELRAALADPSPDWPRLVEVDTTLSTPH